MLKNHTPQERERLLASIAERLLPQPVVPTAEMTEEEELLLGEVRRQLNLNASDNSVAAKTALLQLLGDEMSESIQSEPRRTQIEARLQTIGLATRQIVGRLHVLQPTAPAEKSVAGLSQPLDSPDRCNELCTKAATGYCAVCEALTERDRFIQFWFKGGLLLDSVRALQRGRVFAYLRRYAWPMLWSRNRSTAPQDGYPVSHVEVRHKDVVREAHKQYSETLNRTMLALLGIAFFCLLTVLGSPDKLLLAADSTIKVPFADAPLSFLGFIVVAPFLLIVVLIYLHIFYGYWIACEWERQYINQRLIPPIEGMPTLFSLLAVAPRVLTGFIFYWLVPLALGVITWKAWAFPVMGRPLTYVSGVVIIALVLLQLRRSHPQSTVWHFLCFTPLFLVIGLMVLVTFSPQWFQRPLNLFRVELPKAWLVGINMRRVSADFANLQEANLQRANLQEANLNRANLQEAKFQKANLQGANLQEANLNRATLQNANLQRANLQEADLQEAKLWGTTLQNANLQDGNLQRANFQEPHLVGWEWLDEQPTDLQNANLQRANLQDANLYKANLQRANLQGANLQRANLYKASLQDANLGGSLLRRGGASVYVLTQLEDANLQEANLQGANLGGAGLGGANLGGANLGGANLRGANLYRAYLAEAKNLTQDQLNTACVYENTQLPEGLTRPTPCPARP